MDLLRQRLVLDVRLHAADLAQLDRERRLGIDALAKFGAEDPVGCRGERANLRFAFANEAQAHGLHAAGAEAFADLLPKRRADLVADEAVEDASRLLGVDERHVDVARGLEGPAHGGRRDLVVLDAAELRLRVLLQTGLENLLEMPGDRLSFAVRVGGEEDFVALLRLADEVGDDGLLVLGDDVRGFELRVIGGDADAE